jgi:hypothetical protein
MPAHQVVQVVDVSGNHVTTEQAWCDIDAVHLTLDITTGDSWVLLMFTAAIYIGSIRWAGVDLKVDGVRLGQAYGLFYFQGPYNVPLNLAILVQLPAGLHTIIPQWKMSASGTRTCYASPSYSPAILTAIELL